MSLLVLYVSNNPLDEHQTSQNDVFLFCYHRKIIVSPSIVLSKQHELNDTKQVLYQLISTI